MRTLWLGLFGFLGLAAAGCTLEQSCTAIGCVDQASLQLKPVDGRWADGEYALTVDAEGQRHVCNLRLPADLPARGSATTPQCGIGSMALLQQGFECTETRSGDAVSQSCTPLEGQYALELSIQGMPATFEVELRRDGQVLIDERIALQYETSRPNGPDCEPLCRQARVERSF